MAHDPRYLEGIEKFNAGDYYASHDSWEELWLETAQGEEKSYLQGLILAAVSLHHYRNGNLKGARSRFRRMLEILEELPDKFWGLDLRNFIRRLNGSFHAVLTEEEPPPLNEATVPKIQLRESVS
jgi:predicted metal-dependent hydrolase